MAFRLVVVLSCLIGLGGCAPARPYTPKPGRTMEPIVEFHGDDAVRLRNVQMSTAAVPLGGGATANYAEWTDVALVIAERELTKRGIRRADDATKTLDVAIISAKFEGTMTMATTIEMQVVAGNGYTEVYTGVNSSGFAAYLPAQVDGAMTRVVRDMLSDPALVQYLVGR